MGAMIFVDYRCCRIVTHATSTKQMCLDGSTFNRITPNLLGSSGAKVEPLDLRKSRRDVLGFPWIILFYLKVNGLTQNKWLG